MSKIFYVVLLAILALTNALPRHLRLGLGRIVGGMEASTIPHQISLEYYGEHMCGGSILDKTRILTACHCVDFVTAKEITVTCGTNHINTIDVGAQMHLKVKSISMHEGYDSHTLDNDIAILELLEPLDLSPTNKAFNIEIAGKDYEPKGPVTVTGWGALQEGASSLPTSLMTVTVPLVDSQKCNASYNGDVTDKMICAGEIKGGKDSCQGDSGGPLVDNKNVLVGIVSWGYGCARPNYPGVYTRVSAYQDWIAGKSDAEIRYS